MRLLPTFALLSAVSILSSGAIAADPLTFEKDVRPILKAHCFHCHGESGVVEGSLDVRLKRWILTGGDSGEAIVPGNDSESLLLERVESGDMPPGEKNLSAEDIASIRQWILDGAKTAREEPLTLDDGDYITEEERSFWAFQPIASPEPPVVKENVSDNPIDAFVLDRLHREGLAFSAAADRHTLIRRATFDLWGLPPDPQMVDEFVNDPSPHAYAALIDRLLASPRYGERWGRHWLDVAGYADSDGYTNQDTEREFAYFYRDYVIDSFNDDKPLDQFICEQLAGDEMATGKDASQLTPQRIAQLTATGFLRMAPDGTASGGIDRDLAANETISDTIEIVSTSLLGLTVGCAKCHDHRYDPISQADYFRFRAIFEPALDPKKWKAPRQRRVSLYTEEDRQVRKEIEQKAKQATENRTKRQQEHLDRTLYEELLVVPADRREALETAFKTEKSKRSAEQVALLEEFPNVGNISPGSLYLYAQQRARRASDIERAADALEQKLIEQTRSDQLAKVPAEQREAIAKLVSIPADTWTSEQQQLAAEFPGPLVDASTLKTFSPDGFAELQRYREAALICRKIDAKTDLAKMQDEINAIRATAPKEKFIRVLTEPANHVPPTHLFIRGDHKQPGQELGPSELTVLKGNDPTEIEANDPDLPTTGRRLAYARQLTNGKHPLLARVLMNRVWLNHFGRGIVDSPGDFGFLGSKPTHPELLDWLATDLMRGGWNLKRMHRMIMLSQTYQQVSTRTEQLDRVDPDNRLYARMTVRRLESEAIRDAMLVANGTITNRLHGPPVPVKEDAVGQVVLGKEMLDGERKPTGKSQLGEEAGRRSVYVQVRRSRPLGVLETFDLATVAPNCTIRNYSNVATQALLLMNSSFVIEQADQLAAQAIRAESEVPQQISNAWQRCFNREIENGVLTELTDFVARQTSAFRSRDAKLSAEAAHRLALASACQAMFSSNEFLYVD